MLEAFYMLKKIFLATLCFLKVNSLLSSSNQTNPSFDEYECFRSKIDVHKRMKTASQEYFERMIRSNPNISPSEAVEIERLVKDYCFIKTEAPYKHIQNLFHVPHMIIGRSQPTLSQVKNKQQYWKEIFRVEIAMLQALLPNNPEVVTERKHFYDDSFNNVL